MFNTFKKPTIYYGKSGKPCIDVNKVQFMLHRDYCIEKLEYVFSACPPDMAERQRQLAKVYFGY